MNRSRLAIASLWPLGVALAVLLSAGGASGQTPWTKDPANPVLEAGNPGEWDQGGVLSGAVLFDGTTYHLWYAGVRTEWPDADIGYATSPDGATWTKHPGPVLERQGTWDFGGIFPSAVAWDGATYHMWYGGCVSGSAGPCATGYATSPDGWTWTKHPGNPVLVGETGGWDSICALITAVVPDTGGLRAWYWGGETTTLFAIGYAASPDGVTWTKYADNPVFWPRTRGWDRHTLAFPMVTFEGDTFHMWYSGGPGVCNAIGHAVSADGINWARQPLWEPVLPRGVPGEWDASCIFSPRLVLEGDTAHMWYDGINNQDVFAIGYATAPLPFPEAWLFADDFESGDTSTWSATVP